jgi:hypothetical protein
MHQVSLANAPILLKIPEAELKRHNKCISL